MTAGADAALDRLSRQAEQRRRSAGFWSDAWYRLRRDPVTIAAFAVLGTLGVLAISADLLAQHLFGITFAKQDLLNTYRKPTLEAGPAWWLGGDHLGRSEIVRLLYAARVSLFIGIFSAFVQLTLGLAVGVTAGYFRGWWDDLVVWLVTTLSSMPTLYLLIIVGLLFRLDPVSLAIFIGLIGWTGEANLARGQTFAWKERDFITAAQVVGASSRRIMFRHILPNVLPLMIVTGMITAGGVILAESALSYLGFGIQPPVPSWGNMLNGATQFMTRGPWLVYGPGLAISVTILCLFLIGDGLRDALDPRLRGSTEVPRTR